MTFDLTLIRESLPSVLDGLRITLVMWLVGGVLAFVLGFVVAVSRHFGGRWLRLALTLPVEVLRGTPFLIQLFLLYYGGPFIGLDLEPYDAGLLGLAVYGSAYFAEIIRGGFEAVPHGHIEAAVCVGLDRWTIIRRILVPEMALLILPSAVNFLIILVKETAILSIITVPEFTMNVTAIGSAHFAFVESTFLLALGYWLLVEATGTLGRWAERRLARFKLVA